uniref:C3H1-type domain-containing protein n=1 Tax=Heterosigma akashiwo TaxID=2829 RepID=A0A7S3XM28_HETAK
MCAPLIFQSPDHPFSLCLSSGRCTPRSPPLFDRPGLACQAPGKAARPVKLFKQLLRDGCTFSKCGCYRRRCVFFLRSVGACAWGQVLVRAVAGSVPAKWVDLRGEEICAPGTHIKALVGRQRAAPTPSLPVHMRPGFVPTQQCKYFPFGRCQKGASCTFIHDTNNANSKVNSPLGASGRSTRQEMGASQNSTKEGEDTSRQREEEEASKRSSGEEAVRLAEAAQKRAKIEALRRKEEEDAAKRRREAEEAARVELEAAKRRVEQEAARRSAEEAARIEAEVEAEKRRAEKEEARRNAEEAARIEAEAEAARRRRAEKEAERRNAEEAARNEAELQAARAEKEAARTAEQKKKRAKKGPDNCSSASSSSSRGRGQ